MNFVSMVWNLYLAAVLFSPLYFPVTADSFNCESLHVPLSSICSVRQG